MNKKLLQEIRARADVASKGPWEFDPCDDDDSTIEGGNGGAICHIAMHTSSRAVSRTGENYSHNAARFIANARTDVPLLCDELELLQKLASDLLATFVEVPESQAQAIQALQLALDKAE